MPCGFRRFPGPGAALTLPSLPTDHTGAAARGPRCPPAQVSPGAQPQGCCGCKGDARGPFGVCVGPRGSHPTCSAGPWGVLEAGRCFRDVEPPGDSRCWGIWRWDAVGCGAAGTSLTSTHQGNQGGRCWLKKWNGGDLGWVFFSSHFSTDMQAHGGFGPGAPHQAGWWRGGRAAGRGLMETCAISPWFQFCTGSHPATARPVPAASITARFPFPDTPLPFQNFLLEQSGWVESRRWRLGAGGGA